MANVKITELTAATALAGTDVLPIVDVGADATKKVSVSDLLRNLPDGTASAPALAFADDQNSGILSPAENELAFATSGTQRLVIDSSGRVGIGTSSPGNTLHLKGAQGVGIRFENSTSTNSSYLTIESGDKYQFNVGGSGYYTWVTGGSEKVRIDSSGRVGVGTSSPTFTLGKGLHIADTNAALKLQNTTHTGWAFAEFADETNTTKYILGYKDLDNTFSIKPGNSLSSAAGVTINSSGNVGIGTTSPGNPLVVKESSNVCIELLKSNDTSILTIGEDGSSGALLNAPNGALVFQEGSSEAARIDSSGRLLVGTSSTSATNTVLIQGHSGGSTGQGIVYLAKGAATPANGDQLGAIWFSDNTHTASAGINAQRDGGTWSASSKPSRLVFSTTADGASSPTERMRIDSSGNAMFGTANNAVATQNSDLGVVLNGGNDGRIYATANAHHDFNRTADGEIFRFRSAANTEGNISVSGSTVSYNGAHLSRWSQLAGGAERTEILRGSVLSNLDEMCEWGEEDNEQLNRMKVSDVEGDPNVSGVFQTWDDEDDTYTNDFYCAMTGDFIIRIAQGTTVARGDLLMSAGDGTAKPQDDDIVRSKTIAKVTSTTVSTTYADGSYCVPCVLMAC